MRISKEQARENRERVVVAASELFRARGFDGVGVADLMRAAGFTHGGFYNHFETKEALSAEALRRAFEEMAEPAQRPGVTLLHAATTPLPRAKPERERVGRGLAGLRQR